ncbi:MAG: AurF N-oxygenase family protein [Segniliparus sp.]|uniref:AurF N-oxygenase family protein n=1 Tax=Segniliparus sp. TaxID=2804064 RepID=UPI003F2F3946
MITTATWLAKHDPEADKQYCETLATLSAGSVRRSFDPYKDIDWDSPAFAVVPNDPRWVLPDTDPIASSAWYRALPLERQIEVGMWRQANMAKTGMQFESFLIRGIIQYAVSLPNGSPEYRYSTHEALEECNHNLMFQEMVNRIGADVPGVGGLLRFFVGAAAQLAAQFAPSLFFAAVLAGEEPIDFAQKAVLREGVAVHPILEHVMAIHVAEEARHISFAHEYLRRSSGHMGRGARFGLSLAYPFLMWFVASINVVPGRAFWKKFDVPASVRKDIFWRDERSSAIKQDMFADARALAHKMGIMNPVAKTLWKLFGIDGRPARFRSEPHRRHLAASPAHAG